MTLEIWTLRRDYELKAASHAGIRVGTTVVWIERVEVEFVPLCPRLVRT